MLSKRKTGLKASYAMYLDEMVEGLYVAYKPDGSVRNYYYKNEKGRQVSCTSDIGTAVRLYTEYKARNEAKRYSKIPLGHYRKKQGLGKSEQGCPTVVDTVEVSDEYVVERFVELLEANREQVARKTGIPQLAHLKEVKPIPHSLTLANILDVYLGGKNRSKVYVRDVKRYWTEFVKCTDKKNVRDVTHSDVTNYKKMVHIRAERESIGNKSRYINNRFLAVKAVIHYAAKMTEYTKDIDLLAVYVRQLEKEREHVIKPRIVSKEEMMRLYAASGNSPLGRCLILLGLNCGLRHADIADLRKSDINFAGMKISRPRTKTGIIQSSMLWRETVEAFNQYMAKFPNNMEYVFVTRFGHKYVEKYLRAEFNRVRETAGLPEITQKMLRCTVDSAANGYGINPNAIKIHMGWSISKVDNSYNERPAEATKELVAVIHKHFFE